MRGDRELVGYVPLAGAATDRDLAGPWHEGGGPRYRRALRGRDSRSIAERVGCAVKRSLRGRSVVHGKRRRRRNCDFMRDGAPIIGDLEPRAKWSELASPAWPVMLPYRNRSLPVLSVMMTQAELWDLRPRGSNPYREVNRFRTPPRECFLSLDELKRLGFMLDHADDAESRDEALGPGGAGRRKPLRGGRAASRSSAWGRTERGCANNGCWSQRSPFEAVCGARDDEDRDGRPQAH